jgi:uncharacterized RDD family membrane protein YckC
MPLESSPILASRLTRLVGQILDGVIGVSPMIAAVVVASISTDVGTALVIAGVVFAVAYYFLADGLEGGQSWAKRWLGLAVVDARTGEPCGFGQSFVRNFLLAILGPLDWLFILGGRKQRLGDIVAGTLVVARR